MDKSMSARVAPSNVENRDTTFEVSQPAAPKPLNVMFAAFLNEFLMLVTWLVFHEAKLLGWAEDAPLNVSIRLWTLYVFQELKPRSVADFAFVNAPCKVVTWETSQVTTCGSAVVALLKAFSRVTTFAVVQPPVFIPNASAEIAF
jgi:hypothetical protein